MRPTTFLTTLAITVATIGCGGGATSPQPTSRVRGEIRGTSVALTHASFDGDFTVSAGESWSSSPGLLLFLSQHEPPENRSWTVTASQTDAPDLQLRWEDAESGALRDDVMMDGYELRLSFGTAENDVLPGEITFAVPGEATAFTGSFRAKIIR